MASCARCCGPGGLSCCSWRACPSVRLAAAIRGLAGLLAVLLSVFVLPGVVLPRPVRGVVLVLGLALCSAAVAGGGPAVCSPGNLLGVEAVCRAGAVGGGR